MLTRTRRRVVEEEVTEVVSYNKIREAVIKQQREKHEKRKREEREQRERMKSEWNRLDSFDPWWLGLCQLDVSVAQRLARAGFYHWGGGTECFSCGLCKSSSFWKEGHDPETVHREESPDCEFITGQSDNVPIETWMKYEQNRLDSFPSVKSSVVQHLAKAGFYYRYCGDTECFSCGLHRPSSFWWEGHDPETVHREESPNCKFITGQSENVQIYSQQQNNIKFISQPLLPSVTPTPQEHVTPIFEEHATPIPKEHITPTAAEHVTPIPDEHVTPIPEEHVTPIPENQVTPGEDITPDEYITPKDHVTPGEHVPIRNLTGNTDGQRENVSSENKSLLNLSHTNLYSGDWIKIVQKCPVSGIRSDLLEISTEVFPFLFESLLFQVSVSIVPKENPEYPRHPEFALESERLSTFRTWGAQLTESLSRAGFYYTGEQLLILERPEW